MAKKVVSSNKSEAAFGVAREASRADASSAGKDNIRRDTSARSRVEDERWRSEKQTLRKAALELARRRAQLKMTAISDLATVGEDDSREVITKSLEDPSPQVRNAAVRALFRLDPEFAPSFFNRALREGSSDRRRRLGAALAGSGLVDEAIFQLKAGSQNLYGTISLLFLVAKAGEVEPLIRLVEDHPSIELRLALIELLASSGEASIVPALRRLSAQSSLPAEVRSALTDAVYQISSQTGDVVSSQ